MIEAGDTFCKLSHLVSTYMLNFGNIKMIHKEKHTQQKLNLEPEIMVSKSEPPLYLKFRGLLGGSSEDVK